MQSCLCISQVNSALHPSGVAKSSTSWGKGGKFTSAGWQVTLCDVISRSGVVISITNCYILFTYLRTYLLYVAIGLPVDVVIVHITIPSRYAPGLAQVGYQIQQYKYLSRVRTDPGKVW